MKKIRNTIYALKFQYIWNSSILTAVVLSAWARALMRLLSITAISLLHTAAGDEGRAGEWQPFLGYTEANQPLFPPKPLPSNINALYDFLLEEAESEDNKEPRQYQAHRTNAAGH